MYKNVRRVCQLVPAAVSIARSVAFSRCKAGSRSLCKFSAISRSRLRWYSIAATHARLYQSSPPKFLPDDASAAVTAS